MARKNLNRGLGALAALGALSFHLSKGKGRTDGGAPVEFRGSDSRNDPATYEGAGVTEIGMGDPAAAISDIQREAARREGMNVSEGERVAQGAAQRGDIAQMMDAGYFNRARPAGAAATARPPAGAAGAAAGPAAGAAAGPAAARAPINDREHVFSGPMGPVGSVSQARALINNRDQVFDPRAHGPLTREEAIASIPGQSARAPQGGERITGNETTRNLNNILNAPVPGVMPFGRAASAALRQPPSAVTALPAPARGGASQARLASPQARLTGPSRGTLKDAERAARQERLREQVLQENARSYGLDPNSPGYEAAMRALTRDLGGKDFTLKKKGGAVKKMASGGMTSASKRGDGIASKGKTKCKMY